MQVLKPNLEQKNKESRYPMNMGILNDLNRLNYEKVSELYHLIDDANFDIYSL
jgi:hypothetical protein